ncbi:plasmid mobilization protein [Robinsoniella peoriensis]|uniref:plasmid mobilization protein n=1 Tax=Robinsoniella peoriensis TaxID=180332 RepID=UPI00085C1FA0|nr:plasmid mobilization relaxosome protein MobC [Robinsoniella peoriensis]
MPRRRRNIPLYVMVSPEELEQLHARMDEAGVCNMSAFARKMGLNDYILHVDLSPVLELVSLQRRCSNNINQVAIHTNTYSVYPDEIAGLQKDYTELWGQMNDILKQLSAIVEL